jgi:hypothetical protein
MVALGGGTPGRSRGTRTRSAPGRIAQRTGTGRETASPSMPTGMRSELAVITTVRAVSARRPVVCLPRSRPTACPTLSTVTATTPSTPRSSRARRLRPAMSPVP